MEPGVDSTSPSHPQSARQRPWQGWLHNLLAVILLFVLVLFGELMLSGLPGSPSWVTHLHYWRGYPWLPALVVSVGLVSLSASVGPYLPSRPQIENKEINLVLTILSFANRESLPPLVWWAGVLVAFIAMLSLWLFPQCLHSQDVLISLRISKGGRPLAIIAPRETAQVEPSITVKLQADIEPVSRGMELPILECVWTDAGIGGDGHFEQTTGCVVGYQSGQDAITDPISVQVTQWHCASFGSFPFFVEPRSQP
jgi:hypothetical protein